MVVWLVSNFKYVDLFIANGSLVKAKLYYCFLLHGASFFAQIQTESLTLQSGYLTTKRGVTENTGIIQITGTHLFKKKKQISLKNSILSTKKAEEGVEC